MNYYRIIGRAHYVAPGGGSPRGRGSDPQRVHPYGLFLQ